MSRYKTAADMFLVTAFTPRVHVRHLTVDGWTQWGGFGRVVYTPLSTRQENQPVTHPLCGTGDHDSRYRFADDDEKALPLCRRCKARLNEYIENVQREGEALL